MLGYSRRFPTTYVSGLGQTPEDSVQEWINEIIKPIADVVKEYYDIQAQQQAPQAIQVAKSTTIPSLGGINLLYLIGGGLALWWLFKGSGKPKKSRSRRRRSRR